MVPNDGRPREFSFKMGLKDTWRTFFATDCMSRNYQWKAKDTPQEAEKPDLAPAKQMKMLVMVECINRMELQDTPELNTHCTQLGFSESVI